MNHGEQPALSFCALLNVKQKGDFSKLVKIKVELVESSHLYFSWILTNFNIYNIERSAANSQV